LRILKFQGVLRHAFLGLLFLPVGCGLPTYSVITPLDPQVKNGIMDLVDLELNVGNCENAYTLLQPVYISTSTDNDIRLKMAAVYGCYARVNVFQILSDMLMFEGDFGGGGLWDFLSEEFVSTSNPDDKLPIAAENGTDALVATLKLGTLLDPSSTVNSTSNNPGSIIVDDRTSDANTYLAFMSMSLMGSLLSRHGVAKELPWITADDMQGNGCSFVSGLLNYYDGLSFIASAAPSNVGAIISNITNLLVTGLDGACNAGCLLCGGTVTCDVCPTSLRDRSSCTGSTTDVNSCAGAGVILFVNSSWQ
jgi:hypothetical protein